MRYLLLACVVALSSSCALADTGGARHPDRPCKVDMEKLCPGVQPGGGRIAACMKEHKAQLSDACKARMQEMRAHNPNGGKDDHGPGNSPNENN